jgi:hypothetical protein
MEMHGRAGVESLLMRRLFRHWPHPWVQRSGPLEPLLTAAWRVWRDPVQWWRYASALEVSPARRVLLLPVLLAVSVATRTVEMIGGYRGMVQGDLSRQLATHQEAGL